MNDVCKFYCLNSIHSFYCSVYLMNLYLKLEETIITLVKKCGLSLLSSVFFEILFLTTSSFVSFRKVRQEELKRLFRGKISSGFRAFVVMKGFFSENLNITSESKNEQECAT
ncbi:hypothetical protein P5673_004474 [Acropora cervicornis]|uniref:Uncharacterized protein n=1 Tax=Acropora cervicornis TaxID=6130 RepID=A0AAD9R0A2_ACRCE|nr:hypothetical protein P5673_004474 [Acropora cervicornis]